MLVSFLNYLPPVGCFPQPQDARRRSPPPRGGAFPRASGALGRPPSPLAR